MQHSSRERCYFETSYVETSVAIAATVASTSSPVLNGPKLSRTVPPEAVPRWYQFPEESGLAVEVTTDCDFVEAEVAAAEVLPWGVRVECRLSEPAEEPLEIPVAIRAVRPA